MKEEDINWANNFLKEFTKKRPSRIERVIKILNTTRTKDFPPLIRKAFFVRLYMYKFIEGNDGFIGQYDVCKEIDIHMSAVGNYIEQMVREEIFIEMRRPPAHKKKAKKYIRLSNEPINHKIFKYIKNRARGVTSNE